MSFPPAPDVSFRSTSDQPVVATTPASRNRFVAPGSVTGGEFGMFHSELAAGGAGAGPHLHRGFSESFYVLRGELEIRAGDEQSLARPGDFVYVPREVAHTFRTRDDDVELLMIFAPGAPREGYFEDMARLFERTAAPTVEELDEIAARHDQVNLHDPRYALPSENRSPGQEWTVGTKLE